MTIPVPPRSLRRSASGTLVALAAMFALSTAVGAQIALDEYGPCIDLSQPPEEALDTLGWTGVADGARAATLDGLADRFFGIEIATGDRLTAGDVPERRAALRARFARAADTGILVAKGDKRMLLERDGDTATCWVAAPVLPMVANLLPDLIARGELPEETAMTVHTLGVSEIRPGTRTRMTILRTKALPLDPPLDAGDGFQLQTGPLAE